MDTWSNDTSREIKEKTMPTIKDINTVNAIAEAYIGNGRCKCDALEEVGYKRSFARSGKGTRLYDRPEVIRAIEVAEARKRRNDDFDRSRSHALHMELYADARKAGDNTTCTAVLREMDKLYGLITDKSQVTTEETRTLTASEQEEARRIALIRLKDTG